MSTFESADVQDILTSDREWALRTVWSQRNSTRLGMLQEEYTVNNQEIMAGGHSWKNADTPYLTSLHGNAAVLQNPYPVANLVAQPWNGVGSQYSADMRGNVVVASATLQEPYALGVGAAAQPWSGVDTIHLADMRQNVITASAGLQQLYPTDIVVGAADQP